MPRSKLWDAGIVIHSNYILEYQQLLVSNVRRYMYIFILLFVCSFINLYVRSIYSPNRVRCMVRFLSLGFTYDITQILMYMFVYRSRVGWLRWWPFHPN